MIPAQTIQALKTIEAALVEAGASITDVVRTRIYMANIDHWQEVGGGMGRSSVRFGRQPRWWR